MDTPRKRKERDNNNKMKMMRQRESTLLILSVLSFLVIHTISFHFGSHLQQRCSARSQLSMEYIPDGISKEQWAKIKAKEAEENKGKNLGAIGITKFKSRSFEAWQKTGGEHLFPVDPSVPLEKKPYMQRPGGSSDGEDLKKKGLQGKDQAKFSAKTDVDEKYEKLEKEGKLRSSPFSIPWTAEAAQKLTTANKATEKNGKVSKQSPAVSSPKAAEPEKKKLFGLF